MSWKVVGVTAALVVVAMALYAFGAYFHDATWYGFAYTMVGGAMGYIGGFIHGASMPAAGK